MVVGGEDQSSVRGTFSLMPGRHSSGDMVCAVGYNSLGLEGEAGAEETNECVWRMHGLKAVGSQDNPRSEWRGMEVWELSSGHLQSLGAGKEMGWEGDGGRGL